MLGIRPLGRYLTLTHAGVVVPLAGLEAALGVDELALGKELTADLRQPVPRNDVVVLGPLPCSAAADVDYRPCPAVLPSVAGWRSRSFS